MNKKLYIILFSDTSFNETNIDKLPGYKAFKSVHIEKTDGGLSKFNSNELSLKDKKVSNSNTELIGHVHFKLHSPNKKTINIVGLYRAP